MGFDNESILHPETVPGEYYCPLCRQLVYPSEAQQTRCGHLFCRPCILCILGTTRCCPYDNHPVNETDPKGLQEANASVYQSLCRIFVRCLYNKSGCTWQGQLMDCISHSTSCPFGSSPVICNRCGVQIMHRQAQEHAQTCTGIATQATTQQQMSIQQPPVAHGSMPLLDSSQSGQAVLPVQQQYLAGQSQPGYGLQQIQQTYGAQARPHITGQESQQQQSVLHPQILQPAPSDQLYYQQYHQQQFEQYQHYEQYQQLQQQQVHQQQAPLAPSQQFPPAPQSLQVQESNIQQQHTLQQQPHSQQVVPHLQPSLQQQPHLQQVGPRLQPQPSHPQAQLLLHQQSQIQQSQVQTHPQQPLPQLQQPQPQPQLLQQQSEFPPQHQQQSQSLRPPQQPPQLWEHQQQQQHQHLQHHQQMGWIQDGKPHMGQAPGQAIQVPNANPLSAGFPQLMQQPLTVVQQSVPRWQGQILSGHAVPLAAQQLPPASLQTGQPIPNSTQFIQSNQQLLPQQPAPPTRPVSLHPSSNQLTSLPTNQRVPLPEQVAQLTKVGPSSLAQTVKDVQLTQKVPQPTQKGPSTGVISVNGLSSLPSGGPREPGSVPEKAASGQQLNTRPPPAPEAQQSSKNSQSQAPHNIKQSVRASPSTADESTASLPGKQQQKTDDQLQEDTVTPPKQEKQPSAEPAASNPDASAKQHTVPCTSPKKQQEPPSEISGQQHVVQKDGHQPQKQSPGPKQGAITQISQMQDAQVSSVSQLSPLTTSHGLLQPQLGAKEIPSVHLQNLSHQTSHRPFESEKSSMPPSWQMRASAYENQIHSFSRQTGHAQQQVFTRGLNSPQHSQRQSDLPGKFAGEAQPYSAVSGGVSSLTPSLMNGLPQKGFLEVSKQEFLGGFSRADGSHIGLFEPSREARERMVGRDDDRRFGKPGKIDNVSLGKSDEVSIGDPQRNFEQRFLSRSEESSWQQSMMMDQSWQQSRMIQGSPPRAVPDFISRRMPNDAANSLNVLSRVPTVPFSADLEFGVRSGFAPAIGAGPGLPSDIGQRHKHPTDIRAQSGPSMDLGTRTRFPSEMGTFHKVSPDDIHRGFSPDTRNWRGPPVETSAHHMSPFKMERQDGLPSSVDPRSRFPSDLEPHPGFTSDRESRPWYPSNIESRPRFPVDNELRPGFPSDVLPRPLFPSEFRGHPRFPGPHQQTADLHPESLGLRPEPTRGRPDHDPTFSSPEREHVKLAARREPSYVSSSREHISLSSHLDGALLRPGPEMGQDTVKFEDPRMKNLGVHPNTLTPDPLNQGRQLHFDMRAHPLSFPGPGIGHLSGHAMLEQAPPNFPPLRPPYGFLKGDPFFRPGQMDDNPDSGRKRKHMGSSGWCRICHVDCYTVEGLQNHSQSEEHQKRTLDMVMSIKQDTANKQNQLFDDPKSLPENENKSRRSGGKHRGARRE